MSGNKRTWNEKCKLVLNELEKRIYIEDITEERKRKRRGNDRRQYQTKAEWKKENFRQEVMLRAVMSVAFILTTIALIQGIAKVLPESITVSNTVNGRELPIYCVQTEKPQIALSFDAAWGNEDTATILEILRKHNVKVTFFMTGGWVESYPEDVKAILADGD